MVEQLVGHGVGTSMGKGYMKAMCEECHTGITYTTAEVSKDRKRLYEY